MTRQLRLPAARGYEAPELTDSPENPFDLAAVQAHVKGGQCVPARGVEGTEPRVRVPCPRPQIGDAAKRLYQLKRLGYHLTEKGEALRPVLRAMRNWGLEWEEGTAAKLGSSNGQTG